MENTKIAQLSVEDLNQVIKLYPWFTIARKEIFLKMSLLGEEYRDEGLKKVIPYLINTRTVIRERKRALKEEIDINKPAFSFSSDVEVFKPKTEKQIHVVGGDYFSREDFAELEKDGLMMAERICMKNETFKKQDSESDIERDFIDSRYYTETLANIYTNQGFYAKAEEVYDKLILLYPKKNAYFATLIKDLQKHL